MAEVLLVAPNADALARSVLDRGIGVTAATNLLKARAHVAAQAFDVVFVSADESVWADDLQGVLSGLGSRASLVRLDEIGPEVFSHTFDDLLPAGVAGMTEAVEVEAPVVDSQPGHDDLRELLLSIKSDMSHVVHELNNPLAVISGNAQLGTEIAVSVGADEMLVEAFKDINAAAEQLRGLFSEVTRLRQRIDDAIGN